MTAENKDSNLVSRQRGGEATRGSVSHNGGDSKHWFESLQVVLQHVLKSQNPEQIPLFLESLTQRLRDSGIELPAPVRTPYVNTIAREEEPEYPGDIETERRIKSYVRWNAMAMVVNANRKHEGLGGHISTFASSATLYEVGFNHFFRGGDGDHPADQVYFQGHASPGPYARAYLEGRLNEENLQNFRQDLAETGGLSSYPHPFLMPHFW